MIGTNRYIGSPVERIEDLRFLRGRGEFVGDASAGGSQSVRETAQIQAPHPVQQRHLAILAERQRYAALMADRLPTPAEAAAHVEEIDRIMTGRHAYA